MIRCGIVFRLIVGIAIFALSLIFAGYFAALINRPEFTFYIQIASVSVIFQVVDAVVTSALSSIPSLILLYFTSLNGAIILAIGTIVYLFIYVTFMPLLKIVNDNEIRALETVTGKIPLLNSIARPR